MPFPMSVPPAGTNGTGTIIPVRGLAEKGILRDPSPYQLDVNANGDAMRFAEDVAVNRGFPVRVFRSVADAERWLSDYGRSDS